MTSGTLRLAAAPAEGAGPLNAESKPATNHDDQPSPESKGQVNLYQASANIENQDGRDFIISLREVERRERYSIVQVKFTSGGSVGSALWIAKGMYEIAKSRKQEYWVKLNEWDDGQGHRMYRIGYCSDNTVDPRKHFGGEIDTANELEFLDVEKFDYLFKELWGKASQ